MRNRGNLFAVFASMLGAFGGSIELIHDDPKQPNPRRQSRFARHARGMSMAGYHFDSHGSLRRNTPKRDKSISARQWRKQRRAAREEVAA